MASDDEAGPSNKRVKHDTTEPIMDVRAMNKLFPKIDNLEHFPLKVLLNIFKRLDYMDLYNLAETSCRFEKIAKIVLNERYSHEYFIVDEAKHDQDTYIDFFERFGNEIKAIKAKDIAIRTKDDWIASVLEKAKNLVKLTFKQCHFKSNKNILQQHVNESITHLKFCQCTVDPKGFVLSKFHNLKALQIRVDPFSIPVSTFEGIIRNNPALESLVLDGKYFDSVIEGQLMGSIGTYLKQLKEFAYVQENFIHQGNHIFRQPNHIVDAFVDSLKHLESLALVITNDPVTDLNELLLRLHSVCKGVKHLKLDGVNGSNAADDELMEAIKLFQSVECLKLSFMNNFGDKVESLVEHLPFLRQLEIGVLVGTVDWSCVLVLLRKCPSLEKIVVASNGSTGEYELFGTSQFFNQFIESIGNRNVEIQVKHWSEEEEVKILGCVTKDEVIWRNKVVHWVGYDPCKNLSNIHLLDLAKRQSSARAAAAAAVSNVKQRNPFDLILGYLDLKSLHSFSQANDKCSQLIQSYMTQHSQQDGTFIITNEFLTMGNGNYIGLDMFAGGYVINLRATIVHSFIHHLRVAISRFRNLKTLYINDSLVTISPHLLIAPKVRHLILEENNIDFPELYELSLVCPGLETLQTIDCICPGELEITFLNFRKLKKIIFPYDLTKKVAHVKKLKALVKSMGTELCVLY